METIAFRLIVFDLIASDIKSVHRGSAGENLKPAFDGPLIQFPGSSAGYFRLAAPERRIKACQAPDRISRSNEVPGGRK